MIDKLAKAYCLAVLNEDEWATLSKWAELHRREQRAHIEYLRKMIPEAVPGAEAVADHYDELAAVLRALNDKRPPTRKA